MFSNESRSVKLHTSVQLNYHLRCIQGKIWCCPLFVFWKVKNLINSSRSVAREENPPDWKHSSAEAQRWLQCVGQHRQLISVFITHASIALTYLNGQDSLSGLHPNIKCLQVSNKIWQCFRCCFYSSNQTKNIFFILLQLLKRHLALLTANWSLHFSTDAQSLCLWIDLSSVRD